MLDPEGDAAIWRRTDGTGTGGIILALLMALLVTACDPVLRVNGIVRDRAGRPIDRVSVLLHAEGRGPHPAATDEQGGFHVSIVGAERATVTFSKEGYQSAQVEVGSKTAPLSVVLDPVTR